MRGKAQKQVSNIDGDVPPPREKPTTNAHSSGKLPEQEVKQQPLLPEGEYIYNKNFARCRASRQISRQAIVHNLPALRDAAPAQRAKLLSKKLRLCSYTFEFSDDSDSGQDAKDKELKRATLLELISYLTVFKPSFVDDQLAEIFEMLHCNLFRPLPANTYETHGLYNPEEDEPQSESTWPHLQVVYEFLLRLATATETDPKLLDKYFSQQFVLGLLELFDSEDPRERDYLKTILHRIYGNFMSLRPFIRRAINNVFFRLIYETDRHNGVAELLEILGSIINGFALPLKEQHKQFLVKVLLPLHKVSHVAVFHPQLSYCVTQFLEKDQGLAPKIVGAVLRYWPATTSKKELMFLNELEEILDRVQSRHLGEAQLPLFRQLAKCIHSSHFQVSERALYILNNDIILRFVTNHRQVLLPLMSDALYSNAFFIGQDTVPKQMPAKEGWVPGASTRPHGHWNPTIVELTADILKLFTDMDAALMKSCKERFDQAVTEETANKQLRKQQWEAILAKAQPVLATMEQSANPEGEQKQ